MLSVMNSIVWVMLLIFYSNSCIIDSVVWDFGDGTTKSADETIHHTYQAPAIMATLMKL
jgi:hypothetical protein